MIQNLDAHPCLKKAAFFIGLLEFVVACSPGGEPVLVSSNLIILVPKQHPVRGRYPDFVKG